MITSLFGAIVLAMLLLSGCQDEFQPTFPIPVIMSDDLGDERIALIQENLAAWEDRVGNKLYTLAIVHGKVKTPCQAVQIFNAPGLYEGSKQQLLGIAEPERDEDGDRVQCSRRIRLDLDVLETKAHRNSKEAIIKHEFGHILLWNTGYGDEDNHDDVAGSIMQRRVSNAMNITDEQVRVIRHEVLGVPDFIADEDLDS
jgi:hypothetical protein